MHLNKLTLLNFKNYDEAELIFNKEINCFVGLNGAGKTNLFDAIHYLSLCKSYFNPIDSHQIKYNQSYFMLQGEFEKNGANDTIFCGLKKNKKKVFKKNQKIYTRLADHIGEFPLVMISPNDINLIFDGSEERRKFIDNVISQTNQQYLNSVISYNKNLLQRNSLLKQFCSKGMLIDPDLLAIYDQQLTYHGEFIYETRKHFLNLFIDLFNKIYSFISDNSESVSIEYISQLNHESIANGINNSFQKDCITQRTNFGVHKDDLDFLISEHSLKKFGSQGQQKSFLIAIKLAQYHFIVKKTNIKPLLLLDDIFDKLDSNRIFKLLEKVNDNEFGQIFITDTNRERVINLLDSINSNYKIFNVFKGEVENCHIKNVELLTFDDEK